MWPLYWNHALTIKNNYKITVPLVANKSEARQWTCANDWANVESVHCSGEAASEILVSVFIEVWSLGLHFLWYTLYYVLKYVLCKQNNNIPIFIEFNKSCIIVQIDRNWFHINESLVRSGVTTGGYQVEVFLMSVKISLYLYVAFICVEACQVGLNTILAWWKYP
jgi:hypothetical protein